MRLQAGRQQKRQPLAEKRHGFRVLSGSAHDVSAACFGETALTTKFLRQCSANQIPTGLLSNISNAFPDTNPVASIGDGQATGSRGRRRHRRGCAKVAIR